MKPLKNQPLIHGVVAITGGFLWIVWVIITASRPFLPSDGYRDNEDIAILQAVAMLFISIGIFGVYALQKSAVPRLGKIALFTGIIGAIMAAIGNILLTFFSTNFILVPIFFGPGSLMLLVGIALTGVSIIQARILPAWSGVLLIGSALFGFIVDENSPNVLWGLVLGVAWIVVGSILCFYQFKYNKQLAAK